MDINKKTVVIGFTVLVSFATILRMTLHLSQQHDFWLGAAKNMDFVLYGIYTGDRISAEGYSQYCITVTEIAYPDGTRFQASGKMEGEYYNRLSEYIIHRFDTVKAICHRNGDSWVISSIVPVFDNRNGLSACRKKINELWDNATGLLTVYNRSLADALIFGNHDNLPVSIKSLFRINGCAHLLAMSGMHLGIIVLCFRFVFRIIPWKWVSDLIILLILIFYLYLCSFSPSLTRSVLFFSLLLLSRIFSLKVKTFIILIWTALFQILLFPENFFTLSFQLSYSAFWGLITFASIYAGYFAKKFPIWTADALSGSCSSQLGSSLFILWNIGKMYPTGLIMSLLMIPFIAFYMVLCYLFFLFYLLDLIVVRDISIVIMERVYQMIFTIMSLGEKRAFLEISSISGCCLYLFILIIPLISVTLKRKRGLNLLKDIPYENNRLQFRTGNIEAAGAGESRRTISIRSKLSY